ncbi:MAG: AlkA N-terminal domain-containing protein [Acidimicrobiales bacterium]
MFEDFDRCFAAVQAKDSRFDGWFFTGVVTTGIYCRPSCPAVPPKAENIRFYPSAAAAQGAGFRACKRCRPDAVPGSPEWNRRGDVVARAVRLIGDGVVDREGVAGLGRRLGYSTRQIERQLRAELGAGPLALARSQRAQTARVLLETTGLRIADVAFSAGFSSVRQFNDTVRAVFATNPTDLRRRTKPGPGVPGQLNLRLPFRSPLCPDSLFGHLVATAVPGVEEWREGAYRRTLRLPHGTGTIALSPRPDHVACTLRVTDFRDVAAAVARSRRLLDLDADPVAVDSALSHDAILRPVIAKAPGRRIPRTVDGAELAIRAVLGQQVSTRAAQTHAGRLVAAAGLPIEDQAGALSQLFPTSEAIAAVDPATLGLPVARRRTVIALAGGLADGTIDLGAGADWDRVRHQLGAIPGIGPWTVETIVMRALGDPDAFLPGDLGVRVATAALGLTKDAAERWRPWRAYAVQYLWSTLDHAINRLPVGA